MPPQRRVERHVILEKLPLSSMAGKVPTASVTCDSLTCFRCFRPGHLARDCRAATTNNADQDNPIPLGSRQVVDADTEQCFDSMLYNFKDVCQLMELQDLEPASSVQLKGRLKENIAFWRDIGASKWVLRVIKNGYYLPFISLPARRSFQNHPSVVQNQEFVCQELKKLLASGAIVEVRQENVLVVNPLGVVKNASGKSC